MPINSRAKGARREREFAKLATSCGFPASRGQQFQGSPDSPDIKVPSLPDIHFEVKGVERINLKAWMEQAKRDAGAKVPIVAHKQNGQEWLITLRAEAFFNLLHEKDQESVPTKAKS